MLGNIIFGAIIISLLGVGICVLAGIWDTLKDIVTAIRDKNTTKKG